MNDKAVSDEKRLAERALGFLDDAEEELIRHGAYLVESRVLAPQSFHRALRSLGHSVQHRGVPPARITLDVRVAHGAAMAPGNSWVHGYEIESSELRSMRKGEGLDATGARPPTALLVAAREGGGGGDRSRRHRRVEAN